MTTPWQFRQPTHAASGKNVTFPAGTYHLNMILLLLGATPSGYSFSAATLYYHAAGSILETGNSIVSTGESTADSIIKRDWAWRSNVGGVIWNVAPAAWVGYTGPQKSDGTPTLPSYPLNDATHGALCVTTHSTADASNFHVGDFVYITGGQAVNGSYSASNITQVRTVDATTGAIGITDPLTVNIPWGTGYPAFIENLTTNNVAQHNIGFQNLTILTPSTPVSLNDTYGVTWQHIYMSQTETYFSELFYNEWSARVRIHDNPLITLDFFEFPLSSYLTLGPNNNWYVGQRGKNAFVVNGASTPLNASDNDFLFPCGGGFSLEGTIAEADIEHNQFETLCSDGGSTNGSSTITFGVSLGNSLGYSWIFSNNDIYTNSSRAMAVNSHKAMPTSTIISNNVITWEPMGAASVGIGIASPAELSANILTVRGAAGLADATGVSLLAIPGQDPPTAQGNKVMFIGKASVCFNVADPGSLYTDSIIISDNSCTNAGAGINIGNSGDTPNVSFLGNTIVNPGISYCKVIPRMPS